METVNVLRERKLEIEHVNHDKSCYVSNSNQVNGLTSIGYAKKIAGIYLTSAYNILKDNSSRVSKDALYNTFRQKVSGSITPVVEEDYTTGIVASGIDGVLDTGLHIREPREGIPQLKNDDDVQVSNPPFHENAVTPDPTPLLLLQRRLKSVNTLAANDVTEAICIHQADFLVRNGSKQLSESILYVKRQVSNLSLSSRLDCQMKENLQVVSNVEEMSSHRSIASSLDSEEEEEDDDISNEVDVLLQDKFAKEDVEIDCQINPSCQDEVFKNMIYDSFLIEKKNICNDHHISMSQFNGCRKRTVSSPSSTLYTYRSDDSLEKESWDVNASSDRDNSMPVVFSSVPPKQGSKNEEIRSLLSQSVLVRRHRAYTHRRQRRLLPPRKIILFCFVCAR